MAVTKITTRRSPPASSSDIRNRTILCLNKLSDRDTFAIAAAELERIAQSLPPELFSSFLSCIYDTDSSHRTPVRKQCVLIFSTLALAHQNALSPFVPRMLQSVLRRLRDPDSAVRSACVESVSSVASRVTKLSFSVLFMPFSEAVLLEQEQNVQAAAALCLAAVIDSAPNTDLALLQRILPRYVKLLKCGNFKAKTALITMIASIVTAGGARSSPLLESLVPCLVELLISDDWTVRKAAAETLLKVALSEKRLIAGLKLKDSCLVTFEARRFDKVKAVRNIMKQMLEAWKDIPDISDAACTPFTSSATESENECIPCSSQSSSTLSDSPLKARSHINRLPPQVIGDSCSTNGQSCELPENKKRVTRLHQIDPETPSDWKVEIAVSEVSYMKEDGKDNFQICEGRESQECNHASTESKPDVRRALFSKTGDRKTHRYGSLQFHAHMPASDGKKHSESMAVSNVAEESCDNKKIGDDLFFIRKQLVHIEDQQSSLLHLLQKFIGTSQSGMRSLEARVHGLEMALDEISRDLTISIARMTSPKGIRHTCCSIPHTDFLSSKFWRRDDTRRYLGSKFLTSTTLPSVSKTHGFRATGGYIRNPLAVTHLPPMESSEVASNIVPPSQGGRPCDSIKIQGVSLVA